MTKTQILKYVLFQLAICALTFACCCYPDIVFLLVSVTVQIGLYSSLACQKPFLPCLVTPVASYAVAFLILGDWRLAFASVLFAPVGFVVAYCISKKFNRAQTVLVTALSFGASVVFYIALLFISSGAPTFERASSLISAGITQLADLSVENLPEAYFSQGITAEAYKELLSDSMRTFMFGAFALSCNAVAYFSTAISKKVIINTKCVKINFDGKWQYVLSKPSAAFFIASFICVFVGGDTLTLPERIAFYTVIVALLGGVFLMSVCSIKQRVGTFGFTSVLIYVIVYFMLGFSSLVALLSATGLIATFKYKKEGSDTCKK